MKKILEDRVVLLVVLGLVVFGFMILASGFSSLEIQTGNIVFETPIPGYVPTSAPETVSEAPPPRGGPSLVVIVGGLVFLLTILFLAYRYPRIRYGLLGISIWTAVLLTLIYLYNRFGRPPDEQPESTEFFAIPERVFADIPEELPAWFDTASMFLTLLLFLTAAVVIWWGWRRLRRKDKPALAAVGQDVEAALADLRAGADWQNVIVRCYYDMNRSLVGSLGLRRPEGMTPREFEDVMAREGLPREAVHRLTGLFEQVRYGAQTTAVSDQEDAVACLEKIVASIGRGKTQ